jgi:hypothetical protein
LRKFIGQAARSARKPACISAAMARAKARALMIGRPDALFGKAVGQIIENGERFPYRHIAIDQDRHRARPR